MSTQFNKSLPTPYSTQPTTKPRIPEADAFQALIDRVEGVSKRALPESERPFAMPMQKKGRLVTPTLVNFGLAVVHTSTPQTPQKKRPATGPSRVLSSPLFCTEDPNQFTPFSDLNHDLQRGQSPLGPVTFLASGSYSSVYTATPETVVKAYHGKTKDRFSEIKLTKYLSTSLQNYDDVVHLGLPVAVLLNRKEAGENCYLHQEFIPHVVDPLNTEQMTQVQTFFTASVQNNVMMDLQPQNLRVRDDGTVVLIDFVEQPDPVSVFITKACKAWIEPCRTRKEAVQLLTLLTAGFMNKEPYTAAWFNGIIGVGGVEPSTP